MDGLQTHLGSSYVLLDVARHFRVGVEQAQSLIQVKAGQWLAAGDSVACRPQGNKHRDLAAPCHAHVQLVLGARVLLTVPVAATLPAPRNILLQAAWGIGAASGRLCVIPTQRNVPITLTELRRTAQAGTILALSQTLTLPILHAARQAQVAGLVVAGVSATCLAVLQADPLPVLATAGFGSHHYCADHWLLLCNQNDNIIQIETQPQPVLLLPCANKPTAIMGTNTHIRVGSNVRIIRAPYAHEMGTVLATHTQPQALDNGVFTSIAQVKLWSGRVVDIPNQNLVAL